MDETTRNVAWAIAEAWWRKKNRVAAGSVPEASNSTEYADNFWQGFCEEAKAAIACLQRHSAPVNGANGHAVGHGISASVARI